MHYWLRFIICCVQTKSAGSTSAVAKAHIVPHPLAHFLFDCVLLYSVLLLLAQYFKFVAIWGYQRSIHQWQYRPVACAQQIRWQWQCNNSSNERYSDCFSAFEARLFPILNYFVIFYDFCLRKEWDIPCVQSARYTWSEMSQLIFRPTRFSHKGSSDEFGAKYLGDLVVIFRIEKRPENFSCYMIEISYYTHSMNNIWPRCQRRWTDFRIMFPFVSMSQHFEQWRWKKDKIKDAYLIILIAWGNA